MNAALVERYLRLPGVRPHPGGRLQNHYGFAQFRRIFRRGLQRGHSAAGREANLLRCGKLRRAITGEWRGVYS